MSSVPLPPFPSPQDELEEFLLSPSNLPIHNFRNKQKVWPRKPDPHSLFNTPLCPAHINITVDRDLQSGQLLGYKETQIEEVGLTPKNSTSFQRAPGPLDQLIKGDSTHFPFWPGGLDKPDTNYGVSTDPEEINFEENLLSVPPGFTEGMSFDSSSCSSTNRSVEESRSLKITFDDLFSLTEEDNDDIVNELIDDTLIDKNDTVPDENFDKLIEPHITEGLETSDLFQTPSEPSWAIKVDLQESINDFHERIPNMAHKWTFELDTFQKQAILRLESQECVFVAAHTSAGKTVVAEYAIALSLSHMTRTIYTSPIKALSNQKFHDFRQTFGEKNIGLVTGDVQINKEAPCLIMTTEILRSMLYHGSDIIRDVEWVVFDEVHYINDTERGVVWEEVLIMLPAHVRLILLSATVPNSLEFAEWVGRTKRRSIYVISTLHRPVPLQHFLYTGNSKQTQEQLFMIVGEDKKFLISGYKAALEAKKKSDEKSAPKFGAKGRGHSSQAQDRNVWLSLVYMLQKKEKLPLVAFTFSRKRCDENADSLTNLDLTEGYEKHKINSFFQKSVSILKGSDRELPQVQWMKDLLKRGIAVHHSGILPIIKEIVEMLFGQGLVKLLFATETFAMGVNMPARTVAFDAIRKHDGNRPRELYSGEYVQMAGRAGRRGLDTTGTVIILCKTDVPESGDLHKMILGTPAILESQFRLTYSMLLNILRVQSLRVEDVMMKSFAELDSVRHQGDHHQKLKDIEKSVSTLDGLVCPLCTSEIDQYYQSCAAVMRLRGKIQDTYCNNIQFNKALVVGRCVLLQSNEYHYQPAVILRINRDQSYTALVLCNRGDKQPITLVDLKTDHVIPYQFTGQLFIPDEQGAGHMTVKVKGHDIIGVCKKVLTVDGSRLINDYENRQLPRFKDKQESSEMSKTVELLRQLSESSLKNLDMLDFNIKSLEFAEMREEKERVERTLSCYKCTQCPQFNEHFEQTRKKHQLHQQLAELKFKLSEKSLQFLPEYHIKLKVLKHFNYIDLEGAVQLKGRVACEIHTHEVIITELLFRNVLKDFQPAEVAAMLSCMVLQQGHCSEPVYTDKLKEGKEIILNIAKEIAEVEMSYGLQTSVEDYQKEFKFGLIEVVYRWAQGEEFIKVIELTDMSEGVIVKCVQRLDELCRDISKAGRLVGDPQLATLMTEVSTLIRRDIIFAASLYTI